MEVIERLPNGIDFYDWTWSCKVPNTNVDFSNFVDAATLFDEIKSNKQENQTRVRQTREWIEKCYKFSWFPRRGHQIVMKINLQWCIMIDMMHHMKKGTQNTNS